MLELNYSTISLESVVVLTFLEESLGEEYDATLTLNFDLEYNPKTGFFNIKSIKLYELPLEELSEENENIPYVLRDITKGVLNTPFRPFDGHITTLISDLEFLFLEEKKYIESFLQQLIKNNDKNRVVPFKAIIYDFYTHKYQFVLGENSHSYFGNFKPDKERRLLQGYLRLK